ncbi:MAG: hypothetical protein ACE5EL_06520 [Anaerolineae bacterium]
MRRSPVGSEAWPSPPAPRASPAAASDGAGDRAPLVTESEGYPGGLGGDRRRLAPPSAPAPLIAWLARHRYIGAAGAGLVAGIMAATLFTRRRRQWPSGRPAGRREALAKQLAREKPAPATSRSTAAAAASTSPAPEKSAGVSASTSAASAGPVPHRPESTVVGKTCNVCYRGPDPRFYRTWVVRDDAGALAGGMGLRSRRAGDVEGVEVWLFDRHAGADHPPAPALALVSPRASRRQDVRSALAPAPVVPAVRGRRFALETPRLVLRGVVAASVSDEEQGLLRTLELDLCPEARTTPEPGKASSDQS